MDQGKKLLLLGLTGAFFVVTSILLVAAVSHYNNEAIDAPQTVEQTPTITQAQAVSIASTAIGGQPGQVELERVNGVLQYSVETDQDGKEFDVKIDPYTGSILKIEQETDVGRQEVELIQAKISEQQAISIALAQIPGQAQEVEVEKVNGVYVYEVEVQYEKREFDVAVDLTSGQVLKIEEELQEVEDERDQAPTATSQSTSTPITRQQAEQIALDEIGGGSVGEVDNDRHAGRDAFEVEVRYQGDEFDVLIDKETGEVLDVEEDD